MSGVPPVVELRRARGPLTPFVDFFWSCQRYDAPHAAEHVLPTAAAGLVFRVGEDGRPRCAVAGPRLRYVRVDTARPFTAVGVHFRPGGGWPFFGVPGSDLTNAAVPLDALWGLAASRLCQRVFDAKAPDERFRILERALLDRARERFVARPWIRRALQLFEHSHGSLRVRDVVDHLGVSQRRFVQAFRDEVGLTPKAFCRIQRFNEVLRRVDLLSDIDWADVALACGYWDQAHLNHEFREFCDLSPSEYLRRRVSRTHIAAGD
jgi:AraC-like DNA-binding protein